jgi:hypothetical protein
MKLIDFSLIFLLGTIFSDLSYAKTRYRYEGGNRIIAPFGFRTRQPPSGSSIRLLDVKIGLQAQQVCGYTDWTTTQLHLPKQLLSKQYWKNVGDRVYRQAQQAVMDLSGALPSMLACNVSPTFCHVFNQSELMAAFETDLTFDTCQMLDGIGNATAPANSQLRRCIQNMTSKGRSPSEAREMCINGQNRNGSEPPSKEDKLNNSSNLADSTDEFNMERFINSLFPTSVNTRNGTYYMNSGGHLYSRKSKTKEFMTTLFPGITVRNSATVINGGTFQPNIDVEYARMTVQTRDFILQSVRELHKWTQQGYSPSDAIKKSEYLWLNKKQWEKDKEPSPLHRPTNDGSEPSFIITPNQLLLLVPLVDGSQPDQESELLDLSADRLSSSATFVKLTDRFSDILTLSLDKCKKDPEVQNSVAQRNCDLIVETAKANLQALSYKREAEESAIRAHQLISQMVAEEQKRRLSTPNQDTGKELEEAPKASIKVPGKD